MCLRTILATKFPSHDAEVHGWKVVALRRDKLGGIRFGPAFREEATVRLYAPIGKWINDPHHETLYPTEEDSLPKTYMAGFHMYLDRDSAILKLKEVRSYISVSGRHTIAKATLKGLLAIGTECVGGALGQPTYISTVAVGNMIRIDSIEEG